MLSTIINSLLQLIAARSAVSAPASQLLLSGKPVALKFNATNQSPHLPHSPLLSSSLLLVARKYYSQLDRIGHMNYIQMVLTQCQSTELESFRELRARAERGETIEPLDLDQPVATTLLPQYSTEVAPSGQSRSTGCRGCVFGKGENLGP